MCLDVRVRSTKREGELRALAAQVQYMVLFCLAGWPDGAQNDTGVYPCTSKDDLGALKMKLSEIF